MILLNKSIREIFLLTIASAAILIVWLFFANLERGVLSQGVVVGTARPYTINAPVNGYLVKMPYKEGSVVKKQDLLFSVIDKRNLEILKKYQNEIRTAQGLLDLELTRLERLRDIYLEGLVSSQEISVQQSRVLEVQSRYDEARANYVDITYRNNQSDVLSPDDAIIKEIFSTDKSGFVAAGQKIIELTPKVDGFLIETFVDPKDREYIKVGDRVEVRFTSANQKANPFLDALVLSIDESVLQSSQNQDKNGYRCLVKISDSAIPLIEKEKIVSGVRAEVYFDGGTQNMLSYLIAPVKEIMIKGMRER